MCLLCSSLSVLAQTQLTNLPTFYISTANNTAITSTEIWVDAKLSIVSYDESECIKDSIIKIRGRGNASWDRMLKKSFRIKFADDTRILNMPAKDNNWVLLANFADKTLMRNAVAFEVGRFLSMQYTPAVKYADVVLNGDYIGNYLITDQLNVDKNRVNIQKLDTLTTTLPDITGGYLMEINGTLDTIDDPYYTKTAKGLNIIVKYPQEEDVNKEQLSYIKGFTNTFENTLFSTNYKDPISGYRAMVDTTELVNWYLACEITGNSDAFWSTYWHKMRFDEKLIFGPLWDFDIAFNNDNRLGDATQKLIRVAGFNPKAWITQFASDDWFLKKVYQRFQEIKTNGMLPHLLTYIDDTKAYLFSSQEKNFTHWNILNTIVYRELEARGTYDNEVSFLKSYITERFDYLETALKYTEPPVYTSTIDPAYYYSIINRKTGKAIEVQNASVAENTGLVQSVYDDMKASQQWKFNLVTGADIYTLQNKNSGFVIKNDGQSGTQLTQSNISADSQYQLWKIVKLDNQFVGIQNVLSTQYSINNKGGSVNDNNPIIQYANNITGSQNQQWAFVKQSKVITSLESLNVDSDRHLHIAPQPMNEVSYVTCNFGNVCSVLISVITIDGKTIYMKKTTTNQSGYLTEQLLASELKVKSGLYIVKITASNGITLSAKLLKQ